MVNIDSERLKKSLEEVNRYGLNEETNGINRVGFSDADMAARRWIEEKMKEMGLRTRVDGVGNVFGRFGPDEGGPCIMAGSHLDSVPEGGKYDGVLGVMAVLETIKAIKEASIQLKTAIELVAFAEEEGRFGGMLGSQALSGQVDPDWLEKSKDADGIKLSDAMSAQGFKYKDALQCKRDDIKAFVEIHIEQGPVLEKMDLPIGVVDSISGTTNPIYTIIGEANHSGTTPMNLRKDAGMALFEIGSSIPSIIEEHGSDEARLTIGKVEFSPNFPHTGPGRVDFSLNIRDSDGKKMDAMDAAFLALVQSVCEKRDLEMKVDRSLGRLEPVILDSKIKDILAAEADKLVGKDKFIVMPSGAGHDAQQMQHVAPAGMIFIPSRKGISHSPEEYTDHESVACGTQLLCNALLRLASE